MTNTINYTDPMMAMIVATHARTQVAMADLSELAKEQQHANTALTALRKVEETLREIRSDKTITFEEIEGLRKEAVDAKTKFNLDFDIEPLLQQLEKGLHDVHQPDANDGRGQLVGDRRALEDGDYLYIAQTSDVAEHKTNFENVDSIAKNLESAKDQVRGEVSNREIDMQRMTQEVSTSMQLASNLSKRWSDTDNAIVGNLRA
jgi:hypothetical protein